MLNTDRTTTPRGSMVVLHSHLRTLSLSLSLAMLSAGCGGTIGALRALPSEASAKAQAQAAACDRGEGQACNWLGVWFIVGGAGDDRRGEGARYLRQACHLGLQDSCDLARRAEHSFAKSSPERL